MYATLGDGLDLYLIQVSTSTTINSMFSSSIKVLNSPESCCGLRENTVLRIASDIGEEYIAIILTFTEIHCTSKN